MSRRRGEFEHRTSIFEGAFRAWSHLGGLNPEALETKSASDLDPLSSPISEDPRDNNETNESKNASAIKNPDGSNKRVFPYEPLPRSGLAHPYVQAVLSPWLGPDADHDAIQLGLTTLRTWWQHRRKGASGSAVAALGTDKMRGVVEGYTRHFYNLAHCLVVNDKEQPPRTLHTKMKELEKERNKSTKKRAREEQAGKLASLAQNAGIAHGFNPNDPASVTAELPMDSSLSPLERLHAAQRRQLAESGGIRTTMPNDINSVPLIRLKGKCIPGKIDLPAVVNAVNHHATQLAHRGGGMPNQVTSSIHEQYGDPSSTPVVFVSHNGDIQLAMAVDGITCAHCVKIVETVLKGCNGNKSPIDGLLDAAADRVLCKVLIKIDRSSSAKRISFEASRNLTMVGYTARPHEMSIVSAGADKKVTVDLGALSTAFDVVANTNPQDMFDWAVKCTCPDNGILRNDCSRHSQMNTRIFDAFTMREREVNEYMAGCGQKYGMPCTCGPACRCANCSEHCRSAKADNERQVIPDEQQQIEPMHFSEISPPISINEADFGDLSHMPEPKDHYMVQRNPSIISFGGNMRHMSVTSEATFGRAMSGLSALSIDWENMEDFDINVDHSEHINSGIGDPLNPNSFMGGGARRSSLRRSINAMNAAATAAVVTINSDTDSNHNPQVSFKV